MQVTVFFEVSRKYRKQQLVEVGEDPGSTHQVELDLDTVELREAWVRVFGLATKAAITRINNSIEGEILYRDALTEALVDAEGKNIQSLQSSANVYFRYSLPDPFDHMPDEAEIKAHILKIGKEYIGGLTALAEKTQAEFAEHDRLLALAKPILDQIKTLSETNDVEGLQAMDIPAEVAEFIPRHGPHKNYKLVKKIYYDAIGDAKEARDKARNAELTAQAEAEKAEWIKAHGSDRLKRAFEGGYEVGRIYTLERAAYEAPGWTVDFYDKVEWQDRPSPTTEELDAADEAAKLGLGLAQIVWLTSPPKDYPGDDEYYDESACDFERGVALVIEAYQGKYNLIKQI